MIPDFLFLANVRITNWLTPVWILTVGVSLGFLVTLLLLGIVRFMQRVKAFNSVFSHSNLYWIVGGVTSVVFFAATILFFYWQAAGDLSFGGHASLAFGFFLFFSLAAGFGIWGLVAEQAAGEMRDLIFDGFLKWVNRLCLACLAFALLGWGLDRVNGFGIFNIVNDSNGMIESLVRMPLLGRFEVEFEVEPSRYEDGGSKVPFEFNGSELVEMRILSDRRLEIAGTELTVDMYPGDFIAVEPSDDLPTLFIQRREGGPIPQADVSHIFIKNLGRTTANVQINYLLAPVYREMAMVPIVAISVIGTYLGFLFFSMLFPKIAAVSFSTFKTEIGQPLYWLVLLGAVVFLLGTIFVPYNTFGEDIKMYTDSGLNLLRVAAIFLAVWAASKSVAEEIEGRTALTVLSKPIGRRQFLLGKFVGISLAMALFFMIAGLWFYIWVSFKPIYDYQEASKGLAEWTVCYEEAISVLPGIFLCFLEVVIFVAIAIAISTRMGILANFLICFSIYVVGHLTPNLVQSSYGAFETVAVFAQLVAVVFPVLDHFDVQAAINNNSGVPYSYLGWTVIYTAMYGTIAMLVALVLFEDRDLA